MKKYSQEFKKEAVARSKVIGILDTCKELGVSRSALCKWKKDLSDSPLSSSQNKPSYDELEQEVFRLKKELAYVEEINRILKKSTAIFSSRELGGSK